MRSKTRQQCASGSVDHPYSLMWVAPSLTRCQSRLKRRRWLPGGEILTPRRSPTQYLSLDAAERICYCKDHAHERTKLSIRLSRAALVRTLHERSVDKRRTPDPAKSKSSYV